MKALLDTNIVLDVLMGRKPHAADAVEVFRLIEQGRVSGLLCATTITTLDYLLSQHLKRTEARKLLAHVLSLFEIATVNRAVLEAAMASRMDNFEDAVLDHAAQHSGADVIVTRYSKDFARGKSKVVDPRQFIVLMQP
ncbi:MAG TPA: PIN domain-containing protein [Kiritimatiellia bacterium]|nr:PIN domain-containing protein [Kiritimatiellia bacterium]HMP34142.1 PIN domain-containing protein [Kiritimatiellia bacterium]